MRYTHTHTHTHDSTHLSLFLVGAAHKQEYVQVDKKKKGYVTRAEFITWLQDTIFIDFEHLNKVKYALICPPRVILLF